MKNFSSYFMAFSPRIMLRTGKGKIDTTQKTILDWKFQRNKSWNRNRDWDIYHLSLTTAFFVSLTNNISLWRVSKKQTWKDVYASSKWYIFSADDLNYHLDCKWPLFSNHAPTLFFISCFGTGNLFYIHAQARYKMFICSLKFRS